MTFQDGRAYEPAGADETGWSVVPCTIVPPPPPPPSSPPHPAAARTNSAAPVKSRILRLRPTFSLLCVRPSRLCASIGTDVRKPGWLGAPDSRRLACL